MEILNTDKLKKQVIDNLVKSQINNKLLILSMNPSSEEISFKNFIIKKCQQFGIDFVDKEFDSAANPSEIIDFANRFDKEDGFILLLPFDNYKYLDAVRTGINIKDLDGFTFTSQGKALNGQLEYLPATPKAIAKYLHSVTDLRGKNITIANRNTLIGLPLATYLSRSRATVSIINSITKNQKELIHSSDIFISAIGRANHYDKSYFRDGQILIDVGTSYVNGMIVGDIDYQDLSDLDIKVLTSKKGIGALTTLTLIEGLID